MLNETILKRYRDAMTLQIEDLAKVKREDFARQSAEMQSRGNHPQIHHRIALIHVEKRLQVAWDELKRALEANHVGYTSDLSSELKSLVSNYLSNEYVAKLIEGYPSQEKLYIDRYKPELQATVSQTKAKVDLEIDLYKVDLEIDLYVDSLRSKELLLGQSIGKEKDQHLKILYSRDQAALDFLEWRELLFPRSRPISVLFIDIDKFKLLNERYLHTKVDKTILPQAQQLAADLVVGRGGAYRYAGDEYVLILPNHELPEGVAFAEKLRGVFENYTFRIDDLEESLTVSLGVAAWPADGNDYETVLQVANGAMYEAKKQRNAVKSSLELRPGRHSAQTKRLYYPGSRKELAVISQRLAQLLNTRSVNGMSHDPMLEPSVVLGSLEISEEALAEAADELEQLGWLTANRALSMGKSNFRTISPTAQFFTQTDATFQAWDPEQDAAAIAKFLVDYGKDVVSLQEIDESLH
jgi:diguanylate cyclase (GGDEF)-like protein